MTDEPTPDLSETLEQIAEQAKPVDLSKAVSRKVRILRRRRNAAGGAAAVLAVAIIGGGGWALTRPVDSSSAGGATAAAPSASRGWYAYTPLPAGTPLASSVPQGHVVVAPAPPSLGVVSGVPATAYVSASPSPATTSAPSLPTTTPTGTARLGPLPHQPLPTTGEPGTNPDRTPIPPTTTPISSTAPTTTPATPTTAAPTTPAAPLPCAVFDDFAPGRAGHLVITDAMKAKARAMGDKLCQLVGGGAHFTIEEWISIGGLSAGFNGLTYDVEAHLTGAGAGPVDGEAWLAVYRAPAGTTPTFKDGTMITLQTKLAISLKAQIEVAGGPFDAFATG